MDPRLLRVILLAAAVALTGAAHRAVPVPSRAEQGEAFVPRPEVVRATALGFDALLADYYWLRAVQVVGGKGWPQGQGPLLGRLIDVVTTLNPHVGHPYRFAAVWMTESREEVRYANRLLERSFEHHPDEWRNRFYLGFNHFFYLEDAPAAARALEEAARLPGRPVYLPRLVARLQAKSRGLGVAEAFLREMLRTTTQKKARKQYEEALDELATERVARRLDRARKRYRKRHGRDLARVEDLVAGPRPILDALPPEPHGAAWEIDPETGRIVSTHFGQRFEPNDIMARRARRAFRDREPAPQEGG